MRDEEEVGVICLKGCTGRIGFVMSSSVCLVVDRTGGLACCECVRSLSSGAVEGELLLGAKNHSLTAEDLTV